MKLIIDIPEERYKDIQRIASVQLYMRTPTVEQIIANGTPFQSEKNWVTDRVPTQEEVEEAGDVGFILCVSGKDKNWNYDHAILLGSNYFEHNVWFMENVHEAKRIIVHGWMLPPSWKEG